MISKEIILILFIIIILYYLYPFVKKLYTQYFRNKTINKFKNICDKIKLNMNIEDSMKVYSSKIEHRFTVELHRNIEFTKIMDPIPIEKTLDEVNSQFKIDKHLSDEIYKLSKQGKVEEFFYGKHPFLPYEKIYIGFSTRQNYGYLLEKNRNQYIKRTYINTINFNLYDIFPSNIADKLHLVIPQEILQPKHIYKYDEGKTKPLTCYIGIKSKYNVGNVMEIMNNIMKIFGTNKNIIEQANNEIEKFKNNNCFWLGLTNKYGQFFVTIYYSRNNLPPN